MTLDDAIKFNGALIRDLKARGMIVFPKSIQLGIEALKRLKELREDEHGPCQIPLPGETEE